MLPTLDRLRELLHWDRALSYAMATRIWQSLSGPITVVMLIHALTPQEQGVYYGIVSIAGIQTIFELGLLSILITQTGHEIGIIRRHQLHSSGNEGPSKGSSTDILTVEESSYRIRQLIEGAEKWFFGASLLFLIVAFVFGYRLLLQSEPSIPWLYPFSILLICTMITISLSPHLAILEGAGFRDTIYRARFFQMMLGNLAVWIALGSGLGLWSLAFSAGVQSLMSALVLQVQGKDFFKTYRNAKSVQQDFSWFRNIVPFQWRIAAISITHYFATQLFSVIVLRFHSSSEAGRLGMTISVAGAIQMLALSWVQTKLAVASSHHGAGNREAAGTMWRQIGVLSTGLLLVALSAFILIVAGLPLLERGIEQRFVTPFQLLLLSLGHCSNHLVALQGYSIMSRRSMPLTRASVFGFGCTILAVWIGGYFYSTDGVLWGYFLTTTLIILPLHTLAYFYYRKRQFDAKGGR